VAAIACQVLAEVLGPTFFWGQPSAVPGLWDVHERMSVYSPPPPSTVLHYAHSRRNWHDIQCNFASMVTIIDHWGDFGPLMQQWAGPTTRTCCLLATRKEEGGDHAAVVRRNRPNPELDLIP
jgi:hypothetical protein